MKRKPKGGRFGIKLHRGKRSGEIKRERRRGQDRRTDRRQRKNITMVNGDLILFSFITTKDNKKGKYKRVEGKNGGEKARR